FFFSSRRGHTRFSRDWSSDVCSSDLARAQPLRFRVQQEAARARQLQVWRLNGSPPKKPGDVSPGFFHVRAARFTSRFNETHPARSEERRVGKERSARAEGHGAEQVKR